MRTFSFIVGFLAIVTTAFPQAQTDFMEQSTRDRINYTAVTTSTANSLFTIKGPAGKLIGDPYLDTTWQAGNVKFYNRLGVSLTADSLAGVPVRLDLSTNEVEIRVGARDVKAVKTTAVRYVDMNNQFGSVSRFINSHEYQGEAQAVPGLFEQLTTGKIDLLYYVSVYIQRANYNVAMNTGTKDDQLLKKTDWYVARDKQAVKFSPGKKAILTLMADKKEQIETFLKDTKPDLKSRTGLMSVFSYYNKL